jgi:hypothetical protein
VNGGENPHDSEGNEHLPCDILKARWYIETESKNKGQLPMAAMTIPVARVSRG